MTTMSARDFNRDVSAAKRAADRGPVVITDRGRPAYVLLAAATYEQIIDKHSILDWLQSDSADGDVAFEPARLESLPRAADL